MNSTNASNTQTPSLHNALPILGVVAATGIILDTAVNLVSNDFTASDTTSGAIKLRDNTATLKLGDSIEAHASYFPSAISVVCGLAVVTILNTGNLVVD